MTVPKSCGLSQVESGSPGIWGGPLWEFLLRIRDRCEKPISRTSFSICGAQRSSCALLTFPVNSPPEPPQREVRPTAPPGSRVSPFSPLAPCSCCFHGGFLVPVLCSLSASCPFLPCKLPTPISCIFTPHSELGSWLHLPLLLLSSRY